MGSKSKKLRTSSKFFNKYTLTILGFLVWISFFDQYNLIGQFKLGQSIDKLEKQKLSFEQKMVQATKEKEVMESDIERFAREKHYMHKNDEEIILIERSE